MYFEGHGLAFWATRGDGLYKLHTFGYIEDGDIVGDYIYKMRAHPTLENYLMLTLWDATCFATNYEVCFFKVSDVICIIDVGILISWNRLKSVHSKDLKDHGR